MMTLKNRGTELNENVLGQTRIGMNATKGLDFFVQGLFFRNPFTGVRQQYHGDAGFGLYPVSTDNLEIRLEVAGGYLRENYTFGLRDNFATGRGGVGIKYKLSETADLLGDGSWIYNFEDSNDHRVITTAAISTAVTELLSLKVGFNYMFRNEALPGFKDHDTATTASLVLKL
jgi:putative salt-induced outer membrane protein YdiY